VAILSDEFKAQALYQSRQLGMSQLIKVFVAHPISDQTVKQLHEKADHAFPSAVEALTSNDLQHLVVDEVVEEGPGDEEEVCGS